MPYKTNSSFFLTAFPLFVLCMLLSYCRLPKPINTEQTFVRHDGITTIPDSVVKNKNITKIILEPSWIMTSPVGGMAQIEGANSISLLPDRICDMKKLRVLDLSTNKITNLPKCFFKLSRLEELDLSYNFSFDIMSALPSLLKLKNLKKINLFGAEYTPDNEVLLRSEFEKRNVRLILSKEDMLQVFQHK